MGEIELREGTPRKDRRPRDPDKGVHGSIKKHRHADRLQFRPDHEFFRLADPIVRSERTLLGDDRLYVFWQAVRNVADVPGAIAEIGAYRGGSAYLSPFRLLQIHQGDVSESLSRLADIPYRLVHIDTDRADSVHGPAHVSRLCEGERRGVV